MTTAIRRHRTYVLLLLSALFASTTARRADAFPMDERGEVKLGLRAYTAVRIGTQEVGGTQNPLNWPGSGAGHVRQHRYFLQLDFDHDLTRLVQTGWGPPRLFGLFDQALGLAGWTDPLDVKYTVQYRGEGEGIYDYGPSEYADQASKMRRFLLSTPELQLPGLVNLRRRLPAEYIRERADRIERIARQRHRLFLAYIDFEKGPLFVRIGRQILAWGETDVFRLLDNINPVDDSFGGFFIALDERRLPIEMVRSSYRFGNIGPLQDSFLEGFVATGSNVSVVPGIPPGSPWSPGGIARPNPSIRALSKEPDYEDIRGGARFVFNLGDATASLAHYYTYFDIPGVRFVLPGARDCGGSTGNTARFCNPIIAWQEFPRIPVSGASVTFPVPQWYTIVRSEAAYFQDEPMNRQGRGDANDTFALRGTPGFRRLRAENNTEGGLNPFVWPRFIDPTTERTRPLWGRLLQRDTFNMSVGFDINRFVRQLNPTQTFFITTQFFYKHVFDSPGDLVLPVPYRNLQVGKRTPIVGDPDNPGNVIPGVGGCGPRGRKHACRLQPRLFRLADDRFLQTLLITTSYSGGRIVPSLGMFYDWQGAMVVQPGVQLVRDPFRFVTDYTMIFGNPTGQFGAVRDRDNIRFQVEYVF
jgi:hypothetical protein